MGMGYRFKVMRGLGVMGQGLRVRFRVRGYGSGVMGQGLWILARG